VRAIPAGTASQAAAQTLRAGDGPGLLTTAKVGPLAAGLQFLNAAGTGAPTGVALRQDESLTDADIPAAAAFGGSYPKSLAVVSDDGSLTLAVPAAGTQATGIAGPQTTDLFLSAGQTLALQTGINAPAAAVRLRSGSANVTQSAAGVITAASLGVRAGTGVNLTAAGNTANTFAAQSTSGDVRYATAVPLTVGSLTTDPLTGAFPATTGGQTGSGAVAFTPFGSAALNLTVAAPLAGTTVSATGGTGDDTVTVNYTLGASLASGFTFTGNGGTDVLKLLDTGATAAHTYTVNGTVTRDSAPAITLSDVDTLTFDAGGAGDTFNVTPDANFAVTLNGNNQGTGATGDTLAMTLTGLTTPVLTVTKNGASLSGSAAAANRKTVTFSGVETLTPSADVKVTATGPASIPSGTTGPLTVTVTNTGPSAVTAVPLTDTFPAGLTATWTAVASTGSSVAAASGTGNISTTADLAVGGTVTFTVTLTAATTARGALTNTFTAGAPPAAFELDPSNNAASTTIATGPTNIVAVGAGPGGGPVVVAYNPDGTEKFRRFAFDPAYSGGVTVATGDVNGDGVEDVVAGSAVGASRVVVLDGKTGDAIASFFAFPDFAGGVNVAVAGGRIVAGAGFGGGPVVAVYSLAGGVPQQDARFLAYEAGFRGGVQVGGSDTLLAVGAGPGGGPHVKLFDAATLAEKASFFAFPVGSTDGVTVAVGGPAAAPQVIVGSGIGSVPVVVSYDATTLNTAGSFQAFESSFRGGVRVAAGGVVGGKTTTVVAPGGGGSSRVRIVASDNTTVRDFFAFESAFTGGVYVG
jgi:uncharacterized repeat protein (TIGR01451 family)